MATSPSPPKVDQFASIDDCDKDKPTTASPPFDDPKADLIIRSSDNILFYVHKSLLSIVSPVFEGMFELPNNTSQELYDNRPCLPVTEDSRHLFCLLSWCDPRCNRPSPSLDNLEMTMTIAHKYCMDSIFVHAQKELLAHDFSESDSLRVFAIAIRFQLDALAQKAARTTLGVSLARYNPPQLQHITAFALQTLHNYHHSCKLAVRDLFASDSWAQEMETVTQLLMEVQCKEDSHSHGREYFSLKRLLIRKGRVLWLPTASTAPWWSDYMKRTMFQLHEQPSGSSFKSQVNQTPRNTLAWLERIQKTISLDTCHECRRGGYLRLNAVAKHLSEIIDKAVSKVSFEIQY